MLEVVGVVAVLLGGALFALATYNGLTSKRNRYKNAYAQIDVQLKRRYDLIPTLIEVVRAHAKHDAEILETVVRARNAAYSASQRAAENAGDTEAMQSLASAEAALCSGLSRVLALRDMHPELKASHNLRELNEELSTTETRVAFARQAYNECVNSYNSARATFPAVLLSNALGFASAGQFEGFEANGPAPSGV